MRCEKYSQPCPGYDRVRGFLDEGRNLRRKFANTSLTPGRSSETSISCSAQSSPTSGTPPRPAVSAGYPSPNEIEPTKATLPSPVIAPTSDSSTHAPDPAEADFDSTFFDIDPLIYFAQGNNCCGFIPDVPLVDNLDGLSPFQTEFLSLDNHPLASQAFSETFDSSLSPSDNDSYRDRELREDDLIRHYCDTISPWLDVFDNERYFGGVVPVKAIHSILLKDALAAVAAKQFGHTQREVDQSVTSTRNRSILDLRYDGVQIDWLYEAAGYYDKAIRRMITSLEAFHEERSTKTGTSTPLAVTPHPHLALANSPNSRQAPSQAAVETVDDLLAAVSVFLLYESLDNSQLGMLQYVYPRH